MGVHAARGGDDYVRSRKAGGVLTVESNEFCYQYLRQMPHFVISVSVNFSCFIGWDGGGGGS